MRLASLFPKILSDLNFSNVGGEETLAFRLRTVQRVAAAALGAYLLLRFEPTVVTKLACYAPALVTGLGENITQAVVQSIVLAGYMLLSAPSAALAMAVCLGHRGAVGVIRGFENGNIPMMGVGAGLVIEAYVLSQIYGRGANNGEDKNFPNFLEKLFQKVEDKCTKPLWDLFYSTSQKKEISI